MHPGTARPVSMKDVARRAGVALSSVSRVLGGHPDVSPIMRNRVMDAVAALEYEPNLLAQSLRTGATQTVGFVVGDISNPLMAEIALGAEQRLSSVGFSMLLVNSGNESEADARHIALLRQRQVDGLLISLADETAHTTIQALETLTVPFVLIDRDPVTSDGAVVHSAHDIGMADAVEHLAKLGHERIALVGGPPTLRPSRERVTTLRRTARRLGTAATVRAGTFTADHGYDATMALFQTPSPPTALIAGSNQILVGVLRALRDLRLAIPADVSLVTCDDVPIAEFLVPPIATISRDPRAMGDAAAALLLDLLTEDPSATRTQILPTEFKPTGSCRAIGPAGQRTHYTKK
jgi:LacI family transcriptional regulator